MPAFVCATCGTQYPSTRATLLNAGSDILWDCISLIDDATITLIINGLGGLHAIAISHPPGLFIADTAR